MSDQTDPTSLADISWERVSGSARDIAVGGEGSVWIISSQAVGNNDFAIMRYNYATRSWEKQAGGGLRIAVGPTGQPWVVNASGDIWYGDGPNWKTMKKMESGKGTDIAVGRDGSVWLIGNSPLGGGSKDFGVYMLSADRKRWEPRNGGGVRIAVGVTGQPWLINAAGDLFHGGPPPQRDKWEKHPRLPGVGAVDIAIGWDTAYLTGGTTSADYNVYKWGPGWQTLPGGAVSVGAGPQPWVVNAKGEIYRGLSRFMLRKTPLTVGTVAVLGADHTFARSAGFCCGCPDGYGATRGNGCVDGDKQGDEWYGFLGNPGPAVGVAGPNTNLLHSAGIQWLINGMCHQIANRLAVAGGASLDAVVGAGMSQVGGYFLTNVLFGRVGTWIPGNPGSHVGLVLSYQLLMKNWGLSSPVLVASDFNRRDMEAILKSSPHLDQNDRARLLTHRMEYGVTGDAAQGELDLASISSEDVKQHARKILEGAVGLLGKEKFRKAFGIAPDQIAKWPG